MIRLRSEIQNIAGWFPTLNSSPPGQNGRHFTDNVYKCISLNENYGCLIQISLKFVPKVPIDNESHIGSGNGLAPNRHYHNQFSPCSLKHVCGVFDEYLTPIYLVYLIVLFILISSLAAGVIENFVPLQSSETQVQVGPQWLTKIKCIIGVSLASTSSMFAC